MTNNAIIGADILGGPLGGIKRGSVDLRGDYDDIRALNWSTLKLVATSPLLCKWRETHPRKDTHALLIGRAVHCMVLEPAAFDARYTVYRESKTKGKGAVTAWKDFQLVHADDEILDVSDMADIEASAAAVRAHHVAAELLRGGRAEEVVQWAIDGVACKGRLDYLTPRRLVELKSTTDPSPRSFAADCARYLYHGQVAWYHDGAITAGVLPADADLPAIAAAQSAEPYDVACYEAPSAVLAAGRVLYRELFATWRACRAANWWPGVAPEMLSLILPHWAAGNGPTMQEEDEL